MAKADIIKFRELLLTDTEFQEKLRKASEAYKGEKDEKAVFDNVLTPLAKEYGLSATYEEFREYAWLKAYQQSDPIYTVRRSKGRTLEYTRAAAFSFAIRSLCELFLRNSIQQHAAAAAILICCSCAGESHQDHKQQIKVLLTCKYAEEHGIRDLARDLMLHGILFMDVLTGVLT